MPTFSVAQLRFKKTNLHTIAEEIILPAAKDMMSSMIRLKNKFQKYHCQAIRYKGEQKAWHLASKINTKSMYTFPVFVSQYYYVS